MSYVAARKDLWPLKRAVLVSSLPTVITVVRDKLIRMGWRLAETTDSLERAQEMIDKGEVALLILDERAQEPASSLLRRFIADPLGVLVPTLVMVSEAHHQEAYSISKMGCPEIILLPLTATKLDEAIKETIKRWETPFYQAIRQAYQLVTGGKVESGLRLLTQVNNANPPSSLATQSLAYFYRQLKELKTAEKILLANLQKTPTDMGCILSLSDLYINAAMPAFAYRLLAGAYRAFPLSSALLPELVQSCIMLNRNSEAIDYLYQMIARNYLTEAARPVLAKLLLAEARLPEVEKIPGQRHDLARRIQVAWSDYESKQFVPLSTVAS